MTRLDDIKAREAAATSGPWEVGVGGFYDYEPGLFPKVVDVRMGDTLLSFDQGDMDTNERPSNFGNDAEFIAHAREDIPWLVERIEAVLVVYDNIASECRTAARRRDWALAADLDRARIQLAVALGVES